jgi:hypothetical protein
MEFIEIADGLSIRICEIESVSKGEDELTSVVRTHHNIFRSTLPYSILVSLLERNKEQEEPERREELNILKTLGSYVG